MRWRPHRSSDGTIYNLDHLHPFQFVVAFDTYKGMSARDVVVHVGFTTHVFTSSISSEEDQQELYTDDREKRAFDVQRYELSRDLRRIVSGLERRKCFHTGNKNFVTLERERLPEDRDYRVFFSVRRITGSAVQLIVQSAYMGHVEQRPRGYVAKPVRFRVIVAEAIRGNTRTRQ